MAIVQAPRTFVLSAKKGQNTNYDEVLCNFVSCLCCCYCFCFCLSMSDDINHIEARVAHLIAHIIRRGKVCQSVFSFFLGWAFRRRSFTARHFRLRAHGLSITLASFLSLSLSLSLLHNLNPHRAKRVLTKVSPISHISSSLVYKIILFFLG